MSENPEKCTIHIPVDDLFISGKPTTLELEELLRSLTDWQRFATYLPKINEVKIKEIEKQRLQKVFKSWFCLVDGL